MTASDAFVGSEYVDDRDGHLEKFRRSYRVDPESGCWLFGSGITYGTFKLNGVSTGAHRASWALHRGPIPRGQYVLHGCDVRACVNPSHLYLGDNHRNARDAYQTLTAMRSARAYTRFCERFQEALGALERESLAPDPEWVHRAWAGPEIALSKAVERAIEDYRAATKACLLAERVRDVWRSADAVVQEHDRQEE